LRITQPLDCTAIQISQYGIRHRLELFGKKSFHGICVQVLLPLANVPMIDYTLEWLASAGVEEVLVFCCAHARQIQAYIEGSKWKKQPNFVVTPIVSHNCMSVGEALRLIDEKNLVSLVLCKSVV
jgi:choline kinase